MATTKTAVIPATTEKELEAPARTNFPSRVMFVDSNESIFKLDTLIRIFGKKIQKPDGNLIDLKDEEKRPTPFCVKTIHLALQAQKRTIEDLNSGFFACPAPWEANFDDKTGSHLVFPSCPTLAADSLAFVDLFRPKNEFLAAILKSFSQWAFLSRESGSRHLRNAGAGKLVNVELEVLINHSLRFGNGNLSANFFVGVRSPQADVERLAQYFDFGVASEVVEGLLIVFKEETLIKIGLEEIAVIKTSSKTTKLFNKKGFHLLLNSVEIDDTSKRSKTKSQTAR